MLVSALTLLVLAAPSSRESVTSRVLTELSRTGDVPAAVKALSVLDTNSDLVALSALASLQALQEDYAGAITSWRKLRVQSSSQADLAALDLQLSTLTLLDASRSSARYPSMRAAWLQSETRRCLEFGAAPIAVRFALEGVRLEPRNPGPLILLGVVSDLAARPDEARVAYGKAVELIALLGTESGLLADVCRQGDELERREYIRHAANKAREARDAKKPLVAARWLSEAARASGGFSELSLLSAKAFLDGREGTEAQRQLRGMASIDQWRPSVAKLVDPPVAEAADRAYAHAISLWSSGHKAEAVVAFLDADRLAAGDGFAREAAGEVLFSSGETDRARGLLESLSSARASDVTRHAALGRLLAATGDGVAAAKAFRTVLQGAPEFPGLQRDLGLVAFATGKAREASTALGAARAEWPKDERAALALIDALARAGDVTAARKLADQVVSEVGWSADAHGALARQLTGKADKPRAQAHRLIAERLRLACVRTPIIQLGLLPAPASLTQPTQLARGNKPLGQSALSPPPVVSPPLERRP